MGTYFRVQADPNEVPEELRELWKQVASGKIDRLDATEEFRNLLKTLDRKRSVMDALSQ